MFVTKAKYDDLATAFDRMEKENDYLRTLLDNLKDRDVMARNPYNGRFEKIKLDKL